MEKQKVTTKEFLLRNFVWVAGLAMAIVNLWLATKLYPLAQGISSNSGRISALEIWVDKHEGYSVRIEGKIDKISEDVAILKGRCK